jgi:peptidoglycan hydrolase-like protein with peptidoglycan-binding domain
LPQNVSRTTWMSLLIALALSCLLIALPTAQAGAAQRQLGDRALRVGAKGADVKQLQVLLRQIGMKIRNADGVFGSATKQQVASFQRASNLQPSGVVGKVTVQALETAAAGGSQRLGAGGFDDTVGSGKSSSLGDRIPIRIGMSGHDIKVLQDFLRRVGQKVTIDGHYGHGTIRAVKDFEKTNGLPVDGAVDANDIAVLRDKAGSGPSAAPAEKPLRLAPGDKATVGSDGLAIAPQNAPDSIKAMIAAGNKIAKTPYIYGGGHGNWEDKGYDCSGSVSYALHGAGLLDQSMASGGFMTWSDSGPGQWVTTYANEGHMYMVVAGLRFDTSGAKQDGTRWHATSRPTQGYAVRHPSGL